MKSANPAFPENGLVGMCIKLAQTTFLDALPANAKVHVPAAPQPVKDAPAEGIISRWLDALDNWFYRQQLQQREAYLAQAKDVFELEQRMRDMDHRSAF